MTNRPRAFKKSAIAAGVLALLAGASGTQAASWDFGDVSVTLDSTFTLATSIRVEDRDLDLIGKSNQANFNWTGYNAAFNEIYSNFDVWALTDVGGYSTNGDLGNLAHDPGEAFSTQIAGNHELDINMGDYGFFARAFWFYDFEQEERDRPWSNKITNKRVDLCSDPEAADLLCSDFRLLDAFFYADVWVGDMPLSIRVGEQVISWGESTFIQHGINTTNPVDVTRARAPGSELKEVFIPVGMVYASLGITENFSISGYYQYEWQESLLPVAGSYFATNDFGGEGGQDNNIQLGFTGNPDIDLETLLAQLNGLGDMIRSGADIAQISGAYVQYPRKVAIRGYSDAALNKADDQGQFGVRLTYFAEELNQTEFSWYLINYHSQRPLISGVTSDFTAAGIGHDIGLLADPNVTITRDNITDLKAFTKAEFFFPEDIKLYGFSFNTNVGTTAIAGEIAYRQDEPLQIDDVELLYMGMPEQLATGFPESAGALAGISQLNNIGRGVGPGETAEGFLFSDTMQIQATVSHVFGPMFGSDNFILLGEAAYVDIMDFPDPDVIRLNAPGTSRTPSLEPNPVTGSTNEGLHTLVSDGPETNPFATEDSWGYRLAAVADFNNIFSGINLRSRLTFAHDVDGTTPDPLFLFIEDRKSANLSLTFDYLNKWSASASYSSFWGGIGTTNALSDRDFISFNVKYSI